MKKWQQNNFIGLGLILIIATALRFYDLGKADVITDEASLVLRSIGYLDWLATPYQTTPLEWLADRPWWLYLSFHDHPFFSFFLQFVQLKLTGVSILAMRFWPALYGVMAVWLTYLISKKLFGYQTGVLAALILAVNSLHVWTSRLALQESLVILLTLLSIWIFLRSLEDKRYFYWLGLSAGLALATKLTAIIIWPTVIVYLLIFKREYFKYKELYLAGLITLVLVSPYIIYNIFLYKNFQHFDFQISYLLKQPVEAWQVRPGRAEIPERSQALNFIFLGLKNALSPAELYFYLLSLLGGIIYLLKKKLKNITASFYLLAIITTGHIVLYILIGAGARFLAMMMPWLAITLGLVLKEIIKIKYWGHAVLIIFLIYQMFFSYQTNISRGHWGKKGLSYSPIKSHADDYGYNRLADYMDDFLANKKPAVTLPVVNPNIDNFIKTQAGKQTGESKAMMIVFDQRMYGEAVVWALTRHFLYSGWPVLPLDTYLQALELNGSELFYQMGVKDIYYISATANIILESGSEPYFLDKQKSFEQKLRESAELIHTIYNRGGQAIFEIYKLEK